MSTPMLELEDTWDAVDLPTHGIDMAQAAELRAHLAPFAAADWDAPEMDVYDNYGVASSTRATASL